MRDADIIKDVLTDLEGATKFRLPDAGDLLGIDRKTRSFSRDDFDVLHMPYKACALEYTFSPEKHTLDSDYRHISGKRITLVVDIPAGEEKGGNFQKIIDAIPEFKIEGGLIVTGFWSNDDENPIRPSIDHCAWEIASAVTVIPRHQNFHPGRSVPNIYMANRGDLKIFFAITVQTIFDFHTQRVGPAQSLSTMSADLNDDLHVAFDFMLALSCNNVRINQSTGETRQKLNKKRIANKKVPFFEYKELHIEGVKLDPSAQNIVSRGLTATGRHSPRMHLRRGHMRNLGPGKRTWVNMAIIRASTTGVIQKDYIVS